MDRRNEWSLVQASSNLFPTVTPTRARVHAVFVRSLQLLPAPFRHSPPNSFVFPSCYRSSDKRSGNRLKENRFFPSQCSVIFPLFLSLSLAIALSPRGNLETSDSRPVDVYFSNRSRDPLRRRRIKSSRRGCHGSKKQLGPTIPSYSTATVTRVFAIVQRPGILRAVRHPGSLTPTLTPTLTPPELSSSVSRTFCRRCLELPRASPRLVNHANEVSVNSIESPFLRPRN